MLLHQCSRHRNHLQLPACVRPGGALHAGPCNLCTAHVAYGVFLPGPKLTWHRPTSLDELLELKAAHPAAKLVVGNTEVRRAAITALGLITCTAPIRSRTWNS